MDSQRWICSRHMLEMAGLTGRQNTHRAGFGTDMSFPVSRRIASSIFPIGMD